MKSDRYYLPPRDEKFKPLPRPRKKEMEANPWGAFLSPALKRIIQNRNEEAISTKTSRQVAKPTQQISRPEEISREKGLEDSGKEVS